MIEKTGGSDGARTRDLRRDRPTKPVAASTPVSTFCPGFLGGNSTEVETPLPQVAAARERDRAARARLAAEGNDPVPSGPTWAEAVAKYEFKTRKRRG